MVNSTAPREHDLFLHWDGEFVSGEDLVRATLTGRNLGWLADTLTLGRQLAQENRPYGVFGTSIAGVWIGSALDREIQFYVDEDQERVGRQYFGVPIIAPAAIPRGATVFICLEPQLASAIASRHAGPDRRLVIPPPLASV